MLRCESRVDRKDVFLGNHGIERNIPRSGLHTVNLLTAVGETQQKGLFTVSSPFKREAAIIITATHAQAPTMYVEANQR